MHVVSAYKKHQTAAVVFDHMLNYLLYLVSLLFCPDQSNIEIVFVCRFKNDEVFGDTVYMKNTY